MSSKCLTCGHPREKHKQGMHKCSDESHCGCKSFTGWVKESESPEEEFDKAFSFKAEGHFQAYATTTTPKKPSGDVPLVWWMLDYANISVRSSDSVDFTRQFFTSKVIAQRVADECGAELICVREYDADLEKRAEHSLMTAFAKLIDFTHDNGKDFHIPEGVTLSTFMLGVLKHYLERNKIIQGQNPELLCIHHVTWADRWKCPFCTGEQEWKP